MTAETSVPTLSSAAKRTRKRILTGDRPTGPLHVGNYIGTLANRARLQDEYETFLLVADHHMLTTKLEGLAEIEQNIRDDVVDNLAVGVDPEKVTYFLQSLVPQIPELHLYFSMLVSVPRVQRIPTLKDQLRDHGLAQPTYGLLGYPVLQAADILVVKGELVPVGKDQESHVELTREIARRFNELFAPVFPEPKSLIPDVGLLPGIDGREKMGKSLDNAIYLRDDPKTVERKVMSMYTDPKRIRATDPGTVEGNPVFVYHEIFNSDSAEVDELKRRYREGTVGDVEVKRRLLAALEAFLAPIRERRAELAAKPRLVDEILAAGSERARAEAKETLREVRHAMKLDYFGR
jgi:tryptophanyl-tRNA synthetase